MSDAKAGCENFQWLLDANKAITTAAYQQLHEQLTLLAIQKVQDEESAKDIASECLIYCWQKVEIIGTLGIQQYLADELNRLCWQFLQKKRLRSEIEGEYHAKWSSPVSIWQAFRIGDRMEIGRYFSVLECGEKAVISLMIFEELDLSQIAEKICKPLTTVRVMRDRAIYQLKKRLNPKSLPIHQL